MNLEALFALFERARLETGHREFVVVGSLSILGLSEHFDVPGDMTMSNDVDCFTRLDPERIFDLAGTLGENSPHHLEFGYYLDGVSPALPSLPEGWRDRLIRVERNGIGLSFLDPADAALSKYARGEPRDRRWIRAGLRTGAISLPLVRSRFPSVVFLDDDEQARARGLMDEDAAWLTEPAAGPFRDRRRRPSP